MKKSISKIMLLVVAILAFTQIYAHKPSKGEGNTVKYAVFLNGRPFDFRAFTLESRGTITITEQNNDKKVPFKIYLKRHGEMFFVGQFLVKNNVYETEISEILAYAFGGDELIFELIGNSKDVQKIPIRLKSLEFWRINKDGC